MLVSELISLLSIAQGQHGDVDVIIREPYGEWSDEYPVDTVLSRKDAVILMTEELS